MKEVFSSPDGALLGLFESILDQAGIPYFVRNDSAQQNGVTGLLNPIFPIPECWPSLCVVHDEDYSRAKELLRAARDATPANAVDWKCPACGETVPANFTSCWNCGAESSPSGTDKA
jgi:hypothetical protein